MTLSLRLLATFLVAAPVLVSSFSTLSFSKLTRTFLNFKDAPPNLRLEEEEDEEEFEYEENEQVQRMATFLTLRLGRTLLQKSQRRRQEKVNEEVPFQLAVKEAVEETPSFSSLLDEERPARLHRREGDRMVALGDQFSPSAPPNLETVDDFGVDEMMVMEEEKTAPTVDETSPTATSLFGGETNSDATSATTIPSNSRIATVPSQFDTTTKLPLVVSPEFGRPLEVIQSKTPPLRQPLPDVSTTAATTADISASAAANKKEDTWHTIPTKDDAPPKVASYFPSWKSTKAQDDVSSAGKTDESERESSSSSSSSTNSDDATATTAGSGFTLLRPANVEPGENDKKG